MQKKKKNTRLTILQIAAVEKSLRLLQALVQIAAGTTPSAADAKTWNTARGHFALGKFLCPAFSAFVSWVPGLCSVAFVLFYRYLFLVVCFRVGS